MDNFIVLMLGFIICVLFSLCFYVVQIRDFLRKSLSVFSELLKDDNHN